MSDHTRESAPRVGLFVTCLVDLMRPSVGFAAVKLLEEAGCRVDVPKAQTCCGQPAYNSGDETTARALARSTIAACAGFDYVVVPSGSCAGMLKLHYPRLFEQGSREQAEAEAFAARVHELTQFLADVCQVQTLASRFSGRVTYHDSCSARREMGIIEQPRALLALLAGVELVEMEERETCCGFGGTFCVKYPDISNAMVARKAEAAIGSGADYLVGGDMGCLVNIAGKLSRGDSVMEVHHVAEILAGCYDEPGIDREND